MEVIDTIYNMFKNGFNAVHDKAVEAIEFMDNTIGENIQSFIDNIFTDNIVGETVATLVKTLIGKLPVINDISTFEYIIGAGIIMYTGFVILRFLISLVLH